MLRPSQEAFAELASRGNLVPIVRDILADMDTPVSLFKKLDDGETSFLFESVEGGEKWGRYSFIGRGARAIFRARGRHVEWSEEGRTESFEVEGDPLEVLRERMAAYQPVTLEGVPLPRFLGGAVGMVAYDWVRFVEQIPEQNPDEVDMPDLWFCLPEVVVVHDRVRKHASVVRYVETPEGADLAKLYADAEMELAEVGF